MQKLLKRQRSFFKKDPRKRQKKGQAVLEYTLLVAFMFLIFGMIFSIVRRQLFVIWVCELYPRIAAVGPCDDLQSCFESIGQDGDNIRAICETARPEG